MFTRYEDGAEVDIETVTRYENGAEVDAEAVYKYSNGAEEQAWSNVNKLILLEDSTETAIIRKTSNGFQIESTELHRIEYITLYAEGDFSDPSISFDYVGFCNYLTSTGFNSYIMAGSISIYTLDDTGKENYKIITTPDGNTSIGTTSGDEQGSYSETLSGTYRRVGLKLTLTSLETSSYTPIASVIHAYGLIVDGMYYTLDSADADVEGY